MLYIRLIGTIPTGILTEELGEIENDPDAARSPPLLEGDWIVHLSDSAYLEFTTSATFTTMSHDKRDPDNSHFIEFQIASSKQEYFYQGNILRVVAEKDLPRSVLRLIHYDKEEENHNTNNNKTDNAKNKFTNEPYFEILV